MTTKARGRTVAVLAAALALLAGCGGDGMAEVTGTVTVDGAVVNGSIGFEPVDGKTSTSGGPIKDGKYSFKAPPGAMKVAIRVPKIIGKKKLYNTPNSPEQDVMDETLGEKFNTKTELRFEVKSGNNTKDWELTSKGK